MFYNYDYTSERLKEVEDGYEVVIKTVGIDKVNITNNDNCFSIVGENTINNKHYRYERKFYLQSDVYNNLNSIEYYTECGITIIHFIVNTKVNTFDIRNIKEV